MAFGYRRHIDPRIRHVPLGVTPRSRSARRFWGTATPSPSPALSPRAQRRLVRAFGAMDLAWAGDRSEEHTSELQSLMRISYAVFCLKKKKTHNERKTNNSMSKR